VFEIIPVCKLYDKTTENRAGFLNTPRGYWD